MKNYIYRFLDGTKSVVAVEDGLFEFLTEMDKQERYGNRRETRRHISWDKLGELGIAPAVKDKYDCGELLPNLQNAALYEAVKSLDAAQKKLLYSVFSERKKLKEIAEEEKVTTAAICMRLQTTLEQLRTKR